MEGQKRPRKRDEAISRLNSYKQEIARYRSSLNQITSDHKDEFIGQLNR